jgi:predicted NAD-dependent protein-ADP-ribosyltransferase YbiA (DUF1768 family)
MKRNTNTCKIASSLLALLISTLHGADAMERDYHKILEEIEQLTARIHAEVDQVLANYKRDTAEYHRRMGAKRETRTTSSNTTATRAEKRREDDFFLIGKEKIYGVEPQDQYETLVIINDNGKLKLVGTRNDYDDLFTPTPEYAAKFVEQMPDFDKLLNNQSKFFKIISKKEGEKSYFELLQDSTLSPKALTEWQNKQNSQVNQIKEQRQKYQLQKQLESAISLRETQISEDINDVTESYNQLTPGINNLIFYLQRSPGVVPAQQNLREQQEAQQNLQRIGLDLNGRLDTQKQHLQWLRQNRDALTIQQLQQELQKLAQNPLEPGRQKLHAYLKSLQPQQQPPQPEFDMEPEANPRHTQIQHWLEGKWGEEGTIKFSDLPSDSIAWFGTAHKGFDQNNKDNNGYAWLSNYHESTKDNPNSSFDVNYVIKVKVDGVDYQANNVETFYHLYKLFSNNGKYPSDKEELTEEEKKNRYKEFVKMNPNAARSAAQSIIKFKYGTADRLMFDLLHQKFMNNNKMARELLNTGKQFLLEGNRWGDNRFGIAFNEADPRNPQQKGLPPEGAVLEGQNKLGKMLMQIRTAIAEKMKADPKFASFVNAQDERNVEWIKPCDFNKIG